MNFPRSIMDASDLKRAAADRVDNVNGVVGLTAVPTAPVCVGNDQGASLAAVVGTLSESDRRTMAPLTPDQWIVIINLIATLIGKWLDRRNPPAPVQ